MDALAERFWALVEKTETCWLWQGPKKETGYGMFTHQGQKYRAHRMAYRLAYAEIPLKLLVCHSCDNPGCVRPDHLFLGTTLDNGRDAAAKGRMPRGERSKTAKLCAAQVAEIRRLKAEGLSLSQLARAFDCDQSNISRIVSGQRWAHPR